MSSLIPHDYRYKISSPTPVDKEPFFIALDVVFAVLLIEMLILIQRIIILADAKIAPINFESPIPFI